MGQLVTGADKELNNRLLSDTLFQRVKGIVRRPRAEMVEVPVAERIRSFAEVDQTLTEAAARSESERCLYCCLTCYNPDVGAAGGEDVNRAA